MHRETNDKEKSTNRAAVISKWFPAQESSKGISIAWSGMFAGLAAAPFIIMTIADANGWRATFFVNGALGFLWVLFCAFWFAHNPSEMKGISDEEKKLIESNRRYFNHKQKYSWKKILRNRSLLALVIAFSISQSLNYFLFLDAKLFEKQDISLKTKLNGPILQPILGTLTCFLAVTLATGL
jgi:MFS family permease